MLVVNRIYEIAAWKHVVDFLIVGSILRLVHVFHLPMVNSFAVYNNYFKILNTYLLIAYYIFILTPLNGKLDPALIFSPCTGAPLSDRNTIMELFNILEY